jgi:hypothetical protein
MSLHRQATLAAAAWILVAFSASAAAGAPPPATQSAVPVYSAPMATIEGQGTIKFSVTFGMLVTKDGTPIGLYRTYPSASKVPLGEQWSLGMLRTPAGVVLASQGKTAVLTLHGRIGADVGVYPLTLTYLADFAEHRYASCVLRVAHKPDGHWQTVDGAGHRIDMFTVESHGLGISHITHCAGR